MSLNIIEIERLANLAKLKLSTQEKKQYAEEISAVLKYVEKIQELPVKSLDQLLISQVCPENTNYSRDDVVIAQKPESAAALVRQAPHQQDNLIKTQAVFK